MFAVLCPAVGNQAQARHPFTGGKHDQRRPSGDSGGRVTRAAFMRTMNNKFKDLKDKIETFGRELESTQKRNQMEIVGLKNAID